MKKILAFLQNNALFTLTVFLLVFIPLYPKLPLFDIKNTWVYIRAEDFVVVATLLVWFIFLFTKKITLKTPLTIPILVFWLVGGIATLHGILLIFPTIANVFPNVAFLAYLRHIEYLSLFFVAVAGIRNVKSLKVVIFFLTLTLLGVVLYGLGQKYAGFPAYLTMNEEFAKGVPIQLSSLSRVPSTFAGHYDLAAYLVLVIPILISLIFGIRNWLIKIVLAAVSLGGFVLMIMTVSRVSFVVLLIGIFAVLLFQKKKLVLFSLPVIAILAFLFISTQSSLLSRYTNTVSEVDVLVSGRTGEAIGNIEYVPVEYLEDKSIKLQRVEETDQLVEAIEGEFEEEQATTSALLPIELLPPGTLVPLVKASNVSTGETLPQGTGYINLSLSPVKNRVGDFYYELSPDVVQEKGDAYEVVNFHGNFIIKTASAYDLSFTTRFQGEWPNALTAFARNVFLGSGYGSVSLAIDNNFLRMLAETGLLGTASFFAIFIIVGMYIKRTWPHIDSVLVKSFVIGYIGGVIGLFLNATLIDVFEASKVAFVLWLLTGIVIGVLHYYEKSQMNVYLALRKIAISTPAILIGLFLLTIVVFLPLISNYFIGDDYTWFRWAVDCGNSCGSMLSQFTSYFTNSDGFFYRPGTKVYFAGMYNIFWLNQTIYHLVSIALHFGVIILFFILSLRLLKNKLLAGVISVLFVLLSGYTEVVFWISGTGHLFNALFILLSFLFFMLWEGKKKVWYVVLSFIFASFSLLFHELGVVIPILFMAYVFVYGNGKVLKRIFVPSILLFVIPVVGYLIARFTSNSHWFNGDYSYNPILLPFNFIGNMIGYVMVVLLGPISISFYQILRNVMRDNILVAVIVGIVCIAVFFVMYRYLRNIFDSKEQKTILFGALFFVITLLPFLGLGNITERYSYLATFGVLLILAVIIKKIYFALVTYGVDIARLAMAIGIFVFALFHIIQVQQIHGDWRGAGDMAQRFFVSVDSEYSNAWSTSPVELHFVNVPIRFGNAWVFPVGLEDALYLTFRNDSLKVFKHATIEEARSAIGEGLENRIFEFQGDGSIKEIPRVVNPLTPNSVEL